MPDARRLLADGARGDAAEIQHEHRVVAVAHEDVGTFQCFSERVGADPNKVPEMIGAIVGGHETVGGVDEGDALASGARGGEEGSEDEFGAAAGTGRNEFRDAPGGQATAERGVNPGNAGRRARSIP
ncbi:MAG: hypothetical protein JWM32_2023 [Verrucomicrobia bacterium]|nr:hypothetical protein [Verrucomicrobiota bacterium]